MTAGETRFFDQEGIAELFELRTRDYQEDFALLTRLVTESGGAALDVACGAGRATNRLGSVSSPVIGIDRSARMLKLARCRAANLDRPPLFLQADATAFQLRAKFSLITMVCNSFVDLARPDDQLKCLRNLRDHLAPGGTVLIDITPSAAYERIDGRVVPVPCPDIETTRVECRLLSRMRSRELRLERINYRFYDGARLTRELSAEHERALISHEQFLNVAARAGLMAERVLGSYAGEPYTATSRWQIYILRASPRLGAALGR